MKYVLVKSRHIHRDISEVPTIFTEIKNEQIFDFDWHKKIIHQVLSPNLRALTLYVTGLTPVLVSVINYCALFNISLTLYHYNVNTNSYVTQSVV
jgi:hypothetical protein